MRKPQVRFARAAVDALPPAGAKRHERLRLFVLGAAILAGMGVAVLFFYRNANQERAAERRALQARESELTTVAAAPASALACLDAIAGEAVERLCEKAIFATPEATAAAVSYVSGRLALLADEFAYAKRYDNTFETSFKVIS